MSLCAYIILLLVIVWLRNSFPTNHCIIETTSKTQNRTHRTGVVHNCHSNLMSKKQIIEEWLRNKIIFYANDSSHGSAIAYYFKCSAFYTMLMRTEYISFYEMRIQLDWKQTQLSRSRITLMIRVEYWL